MKYVLLVYYIVVLVEVFLNFVCYDGVCYGLCVLGKDIVEMYENICVEGFGDEVKCWVLIGMYVLLVGYYDVYYLKVQKVCMLIKCDFDFVWQNGVDVILILVMFLVVFGIVDQDMYFDLVKMYMQDVFMVMLNMVGFLGIFVFGGFDKDGLLFGLQLIGKLFDEVILFQFSQVIEDVVGFFELGNWWG